MGWKGGRYGVIHMLNKLQTVSFWSAKNNPYRISVEYLINKNLTSKILKLQALKRNAGQFARRRREEG